MKRLNNKAQMGLENAPNAVVLIGLTFLVMATVAFIGLKYGEAIPSDYSKTVVNETLTTVTETGEYVSNYSACNFESFSVLAAVNATSATTIPTTNYTVSSNGKISFTKGGTLGINNSNWNVTYSYKYAGEACDVNKDLQTNISDNTSIAGIVLTISLVGIVLTVLIGIFLVTRNRKV